MGAEAYKARHCCLEFDAVATRLPEEVRLTPGDAWRLLEADVLGHFVVHQRADEVRPRRGWTDAGPFGAERAARSSRLS